MIHTGNWPINVGPNNLILPSLSLWSDVLRIVNYSPDVDGTYIRD